MSIYIYYEYFYVKYQKSVPNSNYNRKRAKGTKLTPQKIPNLSTESIK